MSSIRVCAYCKEELDIRKKKFCSIQCRKLGSTKTTAARFCPHCGKLATTYMVRGKWKIYNKLCGSKECLDKSVKENLASRRNSRKVCSICHGEYIGAVNSKWCKACVPNDVWRTAASKYGIGKLGFDRMLARQNGTCALCSKTLGTNNKGRDLYIDHDHVTGRVRGILCCRCNGRIVGLDSDREWISRAQAYLA